MSSNWVNALDACAAAGIIDYDAPAFITGKRPRYFGHPQMEQLPLRNDFLLPPGIKLKDVPPLDTYKNPEDRPLVQNPMWKKVLFGALAVVVTVAAVLGIAKLKKVSVPKLNTVANNITKFAKKVCHYVKLPFNLAAKKLKLKP